MTHLTPSWPTPPLHDHTHPYMTHDTPSWPTPPHPQHDLWHTLHEPPTPTWPMTPLHDECELGKNSINNFICPLSWFKKLSPCSYTSPQTHLRIFETLWVIIFWVRVNRKMLNVNWEKIHSIILSVPCHGLRNFPLLIHIPLYPFMNFLKPYELLFFELESLIKSWI